MRWHPTAKALGLTIPASLLLRADQVQDRDDLREMREKVTGKVLTLDRALEPALPALLVLLEVAADNASWQTLDPVQKRQRTLDAVKRLLLREAAPRSAF